MLVVVRARTLEMNRSRHPETCVASLEFASLTHLGEGKAGRMVCIKLSMNVAARHSPHPFPPFLPGSFLIFKLLIDIFLLVAAGNLDDDFFAI
jgi:hypothetical protein